MVLAELEFFHSRPIAPTRRVALGDSLLPTDPAPGFGGLLLGGVVAENIKQLDDDLLPDVTKLVNDLDDGHRIAQPRLRYRFQQDRVGLLRSRLRLVGHGDRVQFELDDPRSTPEQRILAALYAAGRVEHPARHVVMAAIRTSMRWAGPVGDQLVAALSGSGGGHLLPAAAFDDPVAWALEMLEFGADARTADGPPGDVTSSNAGPTNGDGILTVPVRLEVQRRFRALLRDAHPDHGAEVDGAAERIADLREARRILLG